MRFPPDYNKTPGWFIAFWVGIFPWIFAAVITFGIVMPMGWNR